MWKKNGQGKFRGNNRENFKIKNKKFPIKVECFIYLNFGFFKKNLIISFVVIALRV